MDKFISMWKVRELADKVTNVVMNYTEIEGKVREATNDEPWGPTGPLMQELAHATFTYEHFPEVMSMLWKRMLQDNKTNWRRTYKSLLLLNYLVRNGSERVVTSSREHIYDLRSLENYTFVDENGKDQGINVRHKVRELIDFIQDDDKLREERKKAKKNKDKYIGMSSDAMGGMRYGGGGGGGSDYGGYRDSWDRRTDERGYNEGKDRYEYDYQYDGEREDSDTESNGPHANRYYDKERSKSPATRQPSSTLSTHSGSGLSPSSSSNTAGEKKINLNIKSPGAAAAAVKAAATTAAASKPAKKIDMGAAKNFGKSTDLGINSPTHRNTHAEEIISTSDAPSGKQSSNEVLDDLFRTCPAPPSVGSPAKDADFDDFNPRAADAAASGAGQEFGDFESAFGKTVPSKPVGGGTSGGNEFADFAAFSSAQPVAPAAASSDLFFGLNANTTPVAPVATTGANLFGMSPLQSQPHMQQSSSMGNDLLSDLGGLSLGSTNGSMLQPSEGLLQPQLLNANSSNNNSLIGNGTAGSAATKSATNVGTTWKNAGNVNIDLDNLLGNSKGKNLGSAPTMNQMKSIHSSPVHPMPMPMMQQPNPTTAFGAFPATTPQPTSNIPSFMGPGFMNGLNNNSNNNNNNSSSLNFGAFQ
ncbi:clathrin interactor 1 isoform X2 [Armigeres subalbatus]|uniref:clathrin interactor 1 isoform X2 n=1 Tax=Armigeres subalbatus TaxID=124917 RepID=UPI002ED59A35